MKRIHNWSVMKEECAKLLQFSIWTKVNLIVSKMAAWIWITKMRSKQYLNQLKSKCKRKYKNTWPSVGYSCNSQSFLRMISIEIVWHQLIMISNKKIIFQVIKIHQITQEMQSILLITKLISPHMSQFR